MSHCYDFSGLACSRHREHIALYPMVIVLPEEGDRHGKLSSVFSTIIWPVFSSKWQWSQKNAGLYVLCQSFSSAPASDRLTATLCTTNGLVASLWEKASPGVVPHSKERRGDTARLCRKNVPPYARSHNNVTGRSRSGAAPRPRASGESRAGLGSENLNRRAGH